MAALALVAPAAADSPPVGLQVVAREYSFVLSTDTLRDGRRTIELVNSGQDPHNLVLRKGRTLVESVSVAPGQRAQLVVKLSKGRYELYCSLLDHQSLGMDTTLQVKARNRP